MTSHDFARMFWKTVDFETSGRNRMPESGDVGEDHRRTPAPGPFGGKRITIQFKGGSSLLLRLNPIRCLSIDVDIVTQAKAEELIAVLKRVSHLMPLAGS